MTKDLVDYKPFKSEHIPFVHKICEQEFGQGYISVDGLQQFLALDGSIGFVALADNEVVGVSMLYVLDVGAFSYFVLKDNDWFEASFRDHEPIGYRKTIAVKSGHRKMGIGGKLVEMGMNEMDKTANSVVSISWKRKDNQSVRHLLEKHDLKQIKEIPNYWHVDTVLNQYHCLECGAPPCTCTALVYAKFNS